MAARAVCCRLPRAGRGRVLAVKKYRYLGYAYRILLGGLVASLVAFVAPYVAAAMRG